jgi:predicted nucleic acid-binding protein
MALTAAERQKRYRENRKQTDNGYRQINTWISTEAYEALRRMAKRDGVTQREMLERVLIDAQGEIMRRLSDDELSSYLSLNSD